MSNVIDLTPRSRPRRADREADRRCRKADMIARLAAGETVIAAEAAGIGWRRAYVWRAEDAQFRAAWDQARAQVAARPTVTPYPVPASAPARRPPGSRCRPRHRVSAGRLASFAKPRPAAT